MTGTSDDIDGLTHRGGFLPGVAAGVTATLPMTAFMLQAFSGLPRHERYPLPPRLITTKLAKQLGVAGKLNDRQRRVASYVSHFGYGSGVGALYGMTMSHSSVATKSPASGALCGTLFGLAVWSASYLGWLPTVGLHRPATAEPLGRNGLMIAAHVVWGAALGATFAALAKRRSERAREEASFGSTSDDKSGERRRRYGPAEDMGLA
jgi:hypothetical protein